MDFFKKIFRRKREKKDEPKPQPLRIEGCKTTLTPKPDDAELAAQALLENIKHETLDIKHSATAKKEPQQGTVEYYQQLSNRIRQAHDEARLRAMRFVAFCEQELKKPDLPLTGEGSLAMLEAELYKRIDTVEREQGDIKRRWQHCLADIIVRRMKVGGSTSADD